MNFVPNQRIKFNYNDSDRDVLVDKVEVVDGKTYVSGWDESIRPANTKFKDEFWNYRKFDSSKMLFPQPLANKSRAKVVTYEQEFNSPEEALTFFRDLLSSFKF